MAFKLPNPFKKSTDKPKAAKKKVATPMMGKIPAVESIA